MGGMRRVAGALLVLTPTALILTLATPTASACSAPSISVSAARVRPGGTVGVTGTGFVCGGASSGGELAQTHIDVAFVQGTSSTQLAAIDTSSVDPFSVPVTIPANARAGEGSIRAVAGAARASAAVTIVGASLARTGAPTITLAELGLIALVLGTTTRFIAGVWDA